ncbi:MAG TPA: MoaF C-terminal domain-containing protein [Rugosimonospora sp.]|nr:MoaF C-terminal domain-containing protein [Rugosimonospora sp.]
MTPPNLTEFRLQGTDALAGRTLALDPVGVELAFGDTTVDGYGPYEAVEVADRTYFVDIDQAGQDALSVVFSDRTGWALLVAQHRDPDRNPAVEHTFTAARIADRPPVGPAPAPTRDLVGRWHRYRYSRDNLYEHIYLSETRFCSHNLATRNTPGRAACHPVSVYRFDRDVYVVAWREYDSQAAMVVVENLHRNRATGKVLHPVNDTEAASRPVGGIVLPAVVTHAREEDAT